MVAIATLAVSIYILSNLQFRSIKKVMSSVDKIERIFFIKKYLYKLFITSESVKHSESGKPLKTVLDSPKITIISHHEKINEKKSSLKQFSKKIDIIWSEGRWKKAGKEQVVKMISFKLRKKADLKDKAIEGDKI